MTLYKLKELGIGLVTKKVSFIPFRKMSASCCIPRFQEPAILKVIDSLDDISFNNIPIYFIKKSI